MLFKKPGGVSWLIVFLGNPGLKYEGTRHNAGFMAADAMAREKNISINRARFKALTRRYGSIRYRRSTLSSCRTR